MYDETTLQILEYHQSMLLDETRTTSFLRAIIKTVKPGDIVLDMFGGSGSTLIACENLNRRCYTIELDPRYCDVIVKRWEDLTGQKAKRLHE